MPRHDEWRRRQEAAGAASTDETPDDSETEPTGPQEATQAERSEGDVLSALDAELDDFLADASLTPPLDSDVPTAVGAAQSESNPMSLDDSSEFNWVVRFYVSVLGKHRAVTVMFVACLGVVITAVPLMASLPTSTSWAFVGMGMFLTWVVALRLARWAD
jgi:hypothetical protein